MQNLEVFHQGRRFTIAKQLNVKEDALLNRNVAVHFTEKPTMQIICCILLPVFLDRYSSIVNLS